MTKQSIRSLLKAHRSLLLPVAHDALTAKLIAQAGFRAFSIGGFGVAASAFGKPDNGSVGFDELFPVFGQIMRAADLPALVDADTGYGGPMMTARVVAAYEQSGASAIFIEDQMWPKRCGHTNGHRLIAARAMQAKIRAARASLKSPDTILMARTDAISAEGTLAAAVQRSKAYLAAGADALFIEAPRTLQEIREIPQAFPDTPLLINMMEGGKTPLVSQRTLERWGFRMIAHPITSILAQTKAIQDALVQLRRHGTTREWSDTRLFDFWEFGRLIGLEKEVSDHEK